MSDWGPYADEAEAARESYLMVKLTHPEWAPVAWLIATAIGWAESRFGVTKDWLMPDGKPSWNWGATVGKGSAGSIDHADHDKNGKPVVYHFTAWHDPQEGFEFWAKRWPGAAAAQTGDATAVSLAMYRAHWFTGVKGSDADRVNAYAGVIQGAARHIASLTGAPGEVVVTPLPSSTSTTPSGSGSAGGGNGLAILLLLLLLARK